MGDRNWKKILEESYEEEASRDVHAGFPCTKLVYVSEYIFDFTTYQSDVAEFMAIKALLFMRSVTNKTTFEYIKQPENRKWYLVMANMPFFYLKLEWGTSIRGAWWNIYEGAKIPFILSSCGIMIDGEQEAEVVLDHKEWHLFVHALWDFCEDELNESEASNE